MAQENMQDIKRRIRSVSSTKQITKAMALVSTSKLKKARQRQALIKPYSDAVLSSIQAILSESSGINHPMLDKREVKNKAFIVITSDRGLCGGYNMNAIKKATEAMGADTSSKLILVGQKGASYFGRRDYDIEGQFIGVSEEPDFIDATQIANMVTKLYTNSDVDEVNIVYTEFVNTITHIPKLMKILPADELDLGDVEVDKVAGFREYEPSPEVILDYLIPKYLKAAIYGALIESSASEQGARRMAMENASDNADDLQKDLDLRFNRARQAAVTQEISEIVGGSEALS